MLKKNIYRRINIDDIYEHPWITGKWQKKEKSMFKDIKVRRRTNGRGKVKKGIIWL